MGHFSRPSIPSGTTTTTTNNNNNNNNNNIHIHIHIDNHHLFPLSPCHRHTTSSSKRGLEPGRMAKIWFVERSWNSALLDSSEMVSKSPRRNPCGSDKTPWDDWEASAKSLENCFVVLNNVEWLSICFNSSLQLWTFEIGTFHNDGNASKLGISLFKLPCSLLPSSTLGWYQPAIQGSVSVDLQPCHPACPIELLIQSLSEAAFSFKMFQTLAASIHIKWLVKAGGMRIRPSLAPRQMSAAWLTCAERKGSRVTITLFGK